MGIIKWGLIGCGDIARKRVVHALQNAENSQLVAAARGNKNKIKEFTKEFSIPRAYDTWEELLRDPEINAVYIASPVALHASQTIAAAEAGKHVLCEKPLALTVLEGRSMIHSCKQHDVLLGVAYYRHFYPVIERIKEIIASHALGKPVFAQIDALEMFNPDSNHPRSWLLHRAVSGGGPLKDFGCHRIEVLLNLFGKYSQVKALHAPIVFSREVEDTAVVSIQFDSKVIGTVTVSHASGISRDTLTIYFSQGRVHVPSLNAGVLEIETSKGIVTENHPPHNNLHFPLVEKYIAALNTTREFEIDGETGVAVDSIIEQAYGLSNNAEIV
ncbi:MAG: Gfo/Idh/MocA family oxidoreductase [Spirochaetales bacterium]|nr:Gfo/Idh/MocA family oxidoreductase [Spirochaetales bacterium]